MIRGALALPPNDSLEKIMRTATQHGLLAAALGLTLIAATPAMAADPAAWLQRQFTTDHRELGATAAATPLATSIPGIRRPEETGHAFAAAWLRRQLAGETLVVARSEGAAGRAGPIDAEGATTPLSNAWLHHQFTTDHPGPEIRH